MRRFFTSARDLSAILVVICFIVLVPPVTATAADNPCQDPASGWRTNCLEKRSQQLDVEATAAYWRLQNKIKAIAATGSPQKSAYARQLATLLRKNELDFNHYSESYCNLQTVLLSDDTEIDKMLACMIKTSELRAAEINSITALLSKSEAGL